MYFSNKNNFFHGIMFHHFHDDNLHKRSQGSISKDDFYGIIKFIGRNNILNADEFFLKFKEGKLRNNDLCLTFDDGIKSQYDVALPVLEDLKIKAFFFVYTSLLESKPNLLEVYRYFRMTCFENLDDFYKFFFNMCGKDLIIFLKKNEKNIISKRSKFPFYSINDIKFRLARDHFLNKNKYEKIMSQMFAEKNFNKNKFFKILFMNEQNLIKLRKLGHQIGLHSHGHSTFFEKFNYKAQYKEYEKNIKILTETLNCNKNKIYSMSHPCGSYNDDTFTVLKKLGIKIGFKNTMIIDTNMKKINNSKYEIARQDHINIIKLINK